MSKDEQNALVVELKKGSEIAFEKFVTEFDIKIKGMAYNFTRDIEAAKDIAQNVFIKVFQKVALFRNESKLSSWVYRIAINEIFMHFRKAKKNIYKNLDEQALVPLKQDGPEDAMLNCELNWFLMKSAQKLDEKEKQVFLFRDIEDMSTKEVCEAVNATVPAVKSRLLRGRRKLGNLNIGKYLLDEEICSSPQRWTTRNAGQ